MKSKKEANREARSLFRLSYVDGTLDEDRVRKIIKKLKEGEGARALPTLEAYHRLIRLEVSKSRAVVESATALNDTVKSKIISDLENQYGRKIDADFQVKEELVGGFIVRVGDDILDSSLETRLRKLQEAFN